jgi:hypothetical protein
MPKTAKQSHNLRVEQLQKMIEEAQRQPGLDDILQLVYQANSAHQTAEEAEAAKPAAKPAGIYVGGASVSETPSALAIG